MIALSENGTEKMKPADCEVGDWVKAFNFPAWKAGMQEFVPEGSSDGEPWYFAPVFNGPNLFGWQRQ